MMMNDPKVGTPKVRNYSFQNSKRLPEKSMTEVNGIKIPSMAGSCYHAILCALAENKDKFCMWDKIISSTERFMCKYGGAESWKKFCSKSNVKNYKQRIKDNAHTLTRTGKDCYGFRLHERGMCIYYFKDGAMLVTGGTFRTSDNISYDLDFPDGRHIQKRYRGTTMTSREYRRFLDTGLIDESGNVLNAEGIKKIRSQKRVTHSKIKDSHSNNGMLQVSVTLDDSFDQSTANRLESIGLVVDHCEGSDIIGSIAPNRMKDLQLDVDVLEVLSLDH